MPAGLFVPSSSINWCEQDYVVTYYLAEFVNTISNVPPIFVSVAALIAGSIVVHEKIGLNGKRLLQPWIVLLAYIAPIVVFCGSFVFHSTLTYAGQLLDELPMIYGICYFHWMLSAHSKQKNLIGAFFALLVLQLR